ncbi:transcription factor BIM2-like isoform X3 [Nymphaea colorata]|nr:transcription factor BIM2-like isoform X3 [Nymphaea colorata]
MAGKSDGRSSEQRANTPRSKHSATEQRRRSKINDRFQMLRELVPHSDQKRDKASFLLEVIEYIHSLQEKVQKYESLYQEHDEDKIKMMAWKSGQGLVASNMDHLQVQKNSPSFVFGPKFDDSNASVAPSIVANSQNLALPGTLNTSSPFKEKEHSSCFPGNAAGSVPCPHSSLYSPFIRNMSKHPHHRVPEDTENVSSLPQSQSEFWPRPYSTDEPFRGDVSHLTGNERENLVVEDGVINVSSIYSQELLSALTQALRSSGLDLSQASISVQVNLGKRNTDRPSTTSLSGKDHEEPSSNDVMVRLRPESSGDFEHNWKRLKTEREL